MGGSFKPGSVSAPLSAEQQHVVDLALTGCNIFFSGSAGTGKSYLLKQLIRKLEAKHPGHVYATASTGVAAVHIGGIGFWFFSCGV
jgi:hypothetical protein